jgi:NADH dehydrogenase
LIKKIVTASVKRLNKLGVSLRNSERIKSVEEKTILLESGKKFTYDILIWTGGVSAHQIMNTLPLIKDQSGNRIMATEEMLCLPHNEDLTVTKNIYGIGDAICFIDPKTHRPTPGVARVAILQGRISAHNIGQQILAEQNKIKTAVMKTFKPKSYPYILPIGGKFAVAKFGPFLITGILAWARCP